MMTIKSKNLPKQAKHLSLSHIHQSHTSMTVPVQQITYKDWLLIISDGHQPKPNLLLMLYDALNFQKHYVIQKG
jgi:hypothetical protein